MIRKESIEYYREDTDPEVFKIEIERLKNIGYIVLEENEDYVSFTLTVNCIEGHYQ